MRILFSYLLLSCRSFQSLLSFLACSFGSKHLSYVHSKVECKTVEIKSYAAREPEFCAPQTGGRLKRHPGIDPVFPGEAVTAGRKRVLKSAVLTLAAGSGASASPGDLTEDLLVSEGDNFETGTTRRKVVRQFIFRAFLKVCDGAQRGKGPRLQSCVG